MLSIGIKEFREFRTKSMCFEMETECQKAVASNQIGMSLADEGTLLFMALTDPCPFQKSLSLDKQIGS